MSIAKAYSMLVTSLSAAAVVLGSLTTKASWQGCGCSMTAICCQVDYHHLDELAAIVCCLEKYVSSYLSAHLAA